MTKIKVRFNLGAGSNYKKWKITYPSGNIEYHVPANVQLVMKKCQLKNSYKIASKIFNGGNKQVCAWILCEEIDVVIKNYNQSDITGKRIKYNPRIQPNWLIDETNVDGLKVNQIESIGNCLYVTN